MGWAQIRLGLADTDDDRLEHHSRTKEPIEEPMNDASTWTARLAALDLTLPPVATPAGSYLPAVQTGSYVYTSGQLPLVDGTTTCIGKLGEGVSVEDAAQAARLCTLNGLAAVDALVGLDRIVRVVKVVGFVASGSGFSQQPQVINGASDLLAEIFGTAGQHARSAIGVAELPRNSAVEVEFVFEVSDTILSFSHPPTGRRLPTNPPPLRL
jgi:enamine deaminase RidA (YjgF/YER057c/UK114 family)